MGATQGAAFDASVTVSKQVVNSRMSIGKGGQFFAEELLEARTVEYLGHRYHGG